MTNAQAVGLGVRLFSIWLVIQALRQTPGLWLLTHREGDIFGIAAAVAISLLMLLIAAVLWLFPLTVASKLIPRSSLEQSTSVPLEDLQRCGFLLLGLWVLANTIPSFIRYGFFLYYTRSSGMPVTVGYDLPLPVAMLQTVAELIIGIWLLLGAKGLLGLLNWARRAGT